MAETQYVSPRELHKKVQGVSLNTIRKLAMEGSLPCIIAGKAHIKIPLAAGLEALEKYALCRQPEVKQVSMPEITADSELMRRLLAPKKGGKLTDIQKARLEKAKAASAATLTTNPPQAGQKDIGSSISSTL